MYAALASWARADAIPAIRPATMVTPNRRNIVIGFLSEYTVLTILI
jgi:hypothetical protein